MCIIFFFLNDTATTEIYPLPLHDALPICSVSISLERMVSSAMVMFPRRDGVWRLPCPEPHLQHAAHPRSGTSDRKSTRLNSSHANISYAVFCLKKKKPYTVPPYPISFLFL